MSRVFPTDNERWAIKMSIGNRIIRSSNKKHPARKLSIQKPKIAKQSNQKWKKGFMNFIVESKRQILLNARDTIERVEQWQRQSCAMFDMVQQQILHNNLHDDRHEPVAVKNKKKTSKKSTVNRSSAKKSSIAAKKSTAIAKKASVTAKKPKVIAKKPSVTAKTASAAASKTPVEKPSTKTIGTVKKQSSSSIKRNVKNSPKKTAHSSAVRNLKYLPDSSSESSSDEPTENVPIVEKATCPSMPILQAEEIESDDNSKAMEKPTELTAKAVLKRRQSDFVYTPSTDPLVRRKSMLAHSSVLAISNRSPIFEPKSNGEPEIPKKISSTSARAAVDKTNKVREHLPRKIVEKEPEPIPNFLKPKTPVDDDFYTNFERLRERMNQAKKAAEKGNASNGKNGDASGPANPVQEELIDKE